MNFETGQNIRSTLRIIADDMKNDASNFDGRPFNGRTVAEYFGNQGAAIASLARIIDVIIYNDKEFQLELEENKKKT